MSSVLAKEVLEIVNDLDASQLKLEKNAFDVINSSDTSLNLVKDGIGAIEDLVKKIDDLNEAVKLSQQNIEHMKDVSNVIADFAKVISGIANKTNILSLNASIEAARAGEHGRGFAVVSEQIGVLAQQSADASVQTAEIINHTQGAIREGVTMVNLTASSLRQIKETTDQFAMITESLEKVIDKQHMAAEEVRKEIGSVGDIAENNIKTAENTTNSCKEFLNQAQILRELVEQVKIKE